MKKLLTLLISFLSATHLFIQEIQYAVSGFIDDKASYLNSILFEGVPNQSHCFLEIYLIGKPIT